MTNEDYAADGLNFLTEIGSFSYPSCTPVGSRRHPLWHGDRDGRRRADQRRDRDPRRPHGDHGRDRLLFVPEPSGRHLPDPHRQRSRLQLRHGDRPRGDRRRHDHAELLAEPAPTSACPTDTTQADFQTGVATNVDLTTSPGDVILLNAPALDQANTAGTTTGTSFGTTSWGGQTFIPAVTGQLVKVDVQLFCSGCTGTTPNLTLSIRNTSGGLPTGADLATRNHPRLFKWRKRLLHSQLWLAANPDCLERNTL